jgi:flagellar hook-associated protein 2
MDQLSSTINSKLSAIKGEDGKALSTKLTASVSVDGTSIVYTKENDGDDISADRYFKSDFSIANEEVAGNNRLEYERQIVEGKNDTLNITVDGERYTVKLAPGAYGKPSSGGKSDEDIRKGLVSKFDDALKNAVDSDNNSVDLSGNGIGLSARLSFDGTRIELVSKTNKTVSVSGNATSVLGFQSKFEVNMGTKDKASMLLGDSTHGSKVKFAVYNGSKEVDFEYDFLGSDKNKTIDNIIDDIYAKANVKLGYSQLTRKFTLESDGTGADQNVGIKAADDVKDPNDPDDVDTTPATKLFLGNMFSEGGGLNPDGSIKDFTSSKGNGTDVKMSITNPGSAESVTVVKSTNNFTIDGISYSLIKAGGGEETMTVTSNPQKTFDLIKSFVDDYNKMIDSINGKIYEKKQYKYAPLTDEQKKDMKESDIKLWEDKAKEGLISNDSSLQSMMFDIRSAFYDPIKVDANDPNSGNIGTYLTDIGIKTSSEWLDKGKLVIDEKKLKAAIEKDGDKIAELFTKTSSSVPDYSPDLSLSDRKKRYEEQGILQRINDVFQDNLRTTRNANGKKGTLLEKAGIKGDYSEFNNLLSNELKEQDKKINEMIEKLAVKEEKYYLQFARLEKAMNQMNAQSNWMAQQLGTSGNK